ncbi:MAG TPA: hypothetical protein VMM85_01325 [Methylomirabilota bacterium]|nr:hypothetical protein [Methylomirabilota bacterium]
MTTRTGRPRRRAIAAPDLEERIAAAERGTIVMWRGERLPFDTVSGRIARTDGRITRGRLFAGYAEALEALNPLYTERLLSWKTAAAPQSVLDVAAAGGIDAPAMAVELQRFSANSETVYHAALRRYLARIDIEHGDATLADVWHLVRGAAWSHWFGGREVQAAVDAVGPVGSNGAEPPDGWRGAETMLAGDVSGSDSAVTEAIGRAFASVVGQQEWLADELGMAPDEIASFADFAAFVRLWRLRHDLGLLMYELRLYATDEEAVQRAYYSGIVGHLTGVIMPEAGYLHAIRRPLDSVRRWRSAMLGAQLSDALERRHGVAWWRDPASAGTVSDVADASDVEDALARLGYDALDWRPVLRQIRTRLIGEMSGYGGPNITTRAGTRKV